MRTSLFVVCATGLAITLSIGCGGSEPVPSSTPKALKKTPLAVVTIAPAATELPTQTSARLPEMRWQPLPPGTTTIDEQGGYVWDSQTGRLYSLGVLAGAWSPDSSALVMGTCCLDNGYVQILEVPSARSVRVETGDIFVYSWAPDSGSIAVYVSQGDLSGVRVIGRDGSDLARFRLQFAATDIRWLSSSRLAVRANTVGRSGGEEAYFTLDLLARSQEQIHAGASLSEEDPRVLFGETSPNGNWVVYEDGGQTWLWDRDMSETRLLAASRASAQWSADGRLLLIQFQREGEPLPVTSAFDVASDSQRELPEVGLIAQWAGSEAIFHMGIRCLAGGASVGPREIVITAADGSGSRYLTDTPDSFEYEPRVSPRGDLVAYVELATPSAPEWRLHVRDIAGGPDLVDLHTTPATTDGLHIHEGSWSPDSRYLLFWLGGDHGICD